MKAFERINQAYNSVFIPQELSIGVVIPIENYSQSPIPSMNHHLEKVKLVEELGFKAVWVRDVPFNVPTFGDAGQTFDPFTYLGFLAGHTSEIALGVSSIALPLHHPAHVAKAAASLDQLSGGRLILGVASGDRGEEYPAMGFSYEKRSERFREAFQYIRKAQESFPVMESTSYGILEGRIDILPKPTGHKLPMLLTGYSRQSLAWNAEHADGWMHYPRDFYQQKHTIEEWQSLIPEDQNRSKPFMQPLYVILQEQDDAMPQPIQLGIKTGVNYLVEHLQQLKNIGVNHVAINLRFNQLDMVETLVKLSEKVLPLFHSKQPEKIELT